MPLPEWMRKLPHFRIGKCGGAKADCSKMSDEEAANLNWLQKAYRSHDKRLAEAHALMKRAKQMRKDADRDLAFDLRAGDPDKLGAWERLGLLKSKIVFR